MPVTLSAPGGDDCSTAPACGTDTSTAQNGRYTMYVPAGTYTLQTSDAGQSTAARTVVAQAGAVIHAPIALPAPPVPAGTAAHQSARDLRRLNAERVADGLPAGLTLAPRWSAECAAHDGYERDNGVLTSTENPDSPGASVGGAWAGLNSDLGRGPLDPHREPVGERADPPARAAGARACRSSGSTTATGISASPPTRASCARPTATDRISTYPAAGARHVVPAEQARESPFVPGQFVGIPSGRRRVANCSSISTSPTRLGRRRFTCCRPS